MRYYALTVTDASGLTWKPTPNGDGFTKSAGGATFSSWVQPANGGTPTNDAGALNVEFDSVVSSMDQAQGASKITVWGVGLGMISQAANLNGSLFTFEGGMKPGLPLATAAFNDGQTGVLVQGQIYQAYGNWQGVNQTLELICNPGIATSNQKIGFQWLRGQTLTSALQQTFASSFVGYVPRINISPYIFPTTDQHGTYYSLATFASYLQQYTKSIGQQIYSLDGYPGVKIAILPPNYITAYDDYGTPSTIKQLQFQDFIGQPTWISGTSISFKTMLRYDIQVGNMVKFPLSIQTPYVLTASGVAYPNNPVSNKLAFGQGTFTITEVHHFANFRQPDADSWATAFTAAFVTPVNVTS